VAAAGSAFSGFWGSPLKAKKQTKICENHFYASGKK
jgi:hypothetical protein